MKPKRNHLLLGVLALAVLLLFGACGPAGLSVEEAESIQAEIQDVSSRIAAIEDMLAEVEQAGDEELADTAAAAISDALAELSAVSSRLDDIESQLEPPEMPEDETAMDPAMDPAGDAGGF